MDGTPPPPPVELVGSSDGAAVKLSWEARGEPSDRFRVEVAVPGEEAFELVAVGLVESRTHHVPVRSGPHRYRVVAVDHLGQRSEPSEELSVEFAREVPAGTVELSTEGALRAGEHELTLRLDRPAEGTPELALVLPEDAGEIPVELSRAGETWRGALVVPAGAPSGEARFRFRAQAPSGKEGTRLTAGERVRLDTAAPVCTVRVSGAPVRKDKAVVGPGVHTLELRFSEPVRDTPAVTLEVQGAGEGGGPATSEVPLLRKGPELFEATLTVPDDGEERDALLRVESQDRAGNRGQEVRRGRHLTLDCLPPRVVGEFRAVSMPAGEVRLEWTLPWHPTEGEDLGTGSFRLYRSRETPESPPEGTPWLEVGRALGRKDAPGESGRWYYSVQAVDLAGNVGEPSGWASVVVDADPPAPPGNLRARIIESGAVELSWDPPAEPVLFYDAWMAPEPLSDVEDARSLGRRIPLPRVEGLPHRNGTYYFAVTCVDDAMNRSPPSSWVRLDYELVAPEASFYIEPDIWLRDGRWPIRLETSLPLAESPRVRIHAEDGEVRDLVFQGEGTRWRSHLEIDPSWPEGSYGLRFEGESEGGTVGTEVARAPLFRVDRTPPLSPSRLRLREDPRTPDGGVPLAWNTPAPPEEGTPVEIPHYYDVYRGRTPLHDVGGLVPVHTVEVEYENLDEYVYTDLPPDDGEWHYAVVARDLAGNASQSCDPLAAVSDARAPRASIRLFTEFSGRVPTTRVGIGEVRVELTTSRPLIEPPELFYRVATDEKAPPNAPNRTDVTLTGEGRRFTGSFLLEKVGKGDERQAMFFFRGTSEEGVDGHLVSEGERFRIDTAVPIAEITIPKVRRYLPDPATMKPTIPPVPLGTWPVEVSLDEEAVGPPQLRYRVEGEGEWIEVPLSGFGKQWRGLLRIDEDHPEGEAAFEMVARDTAGNVGGHMAPLRRSYRDDGAFPTPRVLEAYATTGGVFSVDRTPPPAPASMELEVRELGVAVLEYEPGEGEPVARWNVYRSLFPIRELGGRKPLQGGLHRQVAVDAPERDGEWYYVVTAEDLAGNESAPSEVRSMFVDSIKPELKIQAVPEGGDMFLILPDESTGEELTVELRFPGGEKRMVKLGGSSGELKRRRDYRRTGRPAVLLPEKLEVFSGGVQVIVHSPDPKGNVVETTVEMPRGRVIPPETGGTVTSSDERVHFELPPDFEMRKVRGAEEERRVTGFDDIFFVSYEKLPEPDTPEEDRSPFAPEPLPLSYELVSAPVKIELNRPPTEPMKLKASATQADLSGLSKLKKIPRMRMAIPEATSELVEDPEYLKKRLRVMRWVPEDRELAEPGKWEPVPPEAVVLDPESKEIIFPVDHVTTYVIVSERTPPSIRRLEPPPGAETLEERPTITATLVDKGTGVAVGASNRIELRIDGRKVPLPPGAVDSADPTEVKVSWTPTEALSPGEHVVTLRGEDVVGNVGIRQWRFTVDNQAPALRAVRPARAGALLGVARPLLATRITDPGSRLEASMVRAFLDGEPVDPIAVRFDPDSGLAVLRAPARLAEGEHRLRWEVEDRGGKLGRHEQVFRVAAEAPRVSGREPRGRIVSQVPERLAYELEAGSGGVSGADIGLWIDGGPIPRDTAGSGQGWIWDPDRSRIELTPTRPLGEGAHEVTLHLADRFGHWRLHRDELMVRARAAAIEPVAEGLYRIAAVTEDGLDLPAGAVADRQAGFVGLDWTAAGSVEAVLRDAGGRSQRVRLSSQGDEVETLETTWEDPNPPGQEATDPGEEKRGREGAEGMLKLLAGMLLAAGFFIWWRVR